MVGAPVSAFELLAYATLKRELVDPPQTESDLAKELEHWRANNGSFRTSVTDDQLALLDRFSASPERFALLDRAYRLFEPPPRKSARPELPKLDASEIAKVRAWQRANPNEAEQVFPRQLDEATDLTLFAAHVALRAGLTDELKPAPAVLEYLRFQRSLLVDQETSIAGRVRALGGEVGLKTLLFDRPDLAPLRAFLENFSDWRIQDSAWVGTLALGNATLSLELSAEGSSRWRINAPLEQSDESKRAIRRARSEASLDPVSISLQGDELSFVDPLVPSSPQFLQALRRRFDVH